MVDRAVCCAALWHSAVSHKFSLLACGKMDTTSGVTNTRGPLVGALHVLCPLDQVDERQQFVQDWEKVMKMAGQAKSLQSFWIFHWYTFLNDLDDTANDFPDDPLFVKFVWNRIMKTNDREVACAAPPCAAGLCPVPVTRRL